jgi:PKD repeat protein
MFDFLCSRVKRDVASPSILLRIMPIRFLCVLAVAVSCARCALDTPTKPTSSSQAKGTPSRLELNAVVPTGANGGTATVTARVLDAFGTIVVGTPVDFTASSGSFSETPAMTSDKGIASTILTADPGTVTITAKTASVQSQTTVSVQPRVVTPTPGPNPPPPPPPGPPAPGPFSVSATSSTVAVGAATSFIANVGGATPPVRATWDFGDGGTFAGTTIGNQPTASHTYATIGSFHATVIVQDAAGHSGSASTDAQVTATPPPPPPTLAVTLAASPASVAAFTSTTLTATATATNGAAAATLYTIDCGDGLGPATSASKTRTCPGYSTPGTATATVTATNGAQSATASTTVTVTAAPTPTIVVDCSAGTSTTPGPGVVSACNVSATLGTTPVNPATITIVSWAWGDGGTGTTGLAQVSQSHQYTLPSGTTGYAVIVTATVPNGGAAGTGTGHAVVH